MTKSILTSQQRKFLDLFSKSKSLNQSFYLTGGTALCEFYLPFRYSEDLDFFSEVEFELLGITAFIKSLKGELGYKKIDINTSFNRNIFQLIFDKEVLKVEFTYFPFPQIKKPITKMGVQVDSLLDIAVNKLFTIYQKPRSRDFIDLYMINQQYHYKIDDLISKARLKFDWHVDPIKLGSQFLEAKQLKDYPKLIKKLNHARWQEFFQKEAKKLKKEIFKPS